MLQGTFYGQQSDQDAAGACSYGKNFANSTKMPWSSNADMTVALNDAQWELGAGCGLCVRFRGTGAGIGTTPIATSHWQTGFVNNRCGLLLSARNDLTCSNQTHPCSRVRSLGPNKRRVRKLCNNLSADRLP